MIASAKPSESFGFTILAYSPLGIVSSVPPIFVPITGVPHIKEHKREIGVDSRAETEGETTISEALNKLQRCASATNPIKATFFKPRVCV